MPASYPSPRTPDTFKILLKKLVQAPDDFSPEDCAECFEHLCQTEDASKDQARAASDSQIGAFLTALTLSGFDTSAPYIASCASVLRTHSVQIASLLQPTPSEATTPTPESQLPDTRPTAEESAKPEGKLSHLLSSLTGSKKVSEEELWDYSKTDGEGEGYTGLVDIVGTGGDGFDTFNVSTTAAVVVAGCGVRVAKHGSKAATSTSGSADLLLSLSCSLTFPPSSLPTIHPHTPFLFLFAAHYHPALAHIAPIRRHINFRTIFNVLGPLINPARPQRMVLGVARKELGGVFVEVLRRMNVQRGLVVCGKEGLDEISIAGESWAWELESGEIKEYTLHPTRDFGLPCHSLESVKGSTPDLNAMTFHSLLFSSQLPPPHLSAPAGPDSPSLNAILDFVLLNAAAVLKISGRAATWKEGVEIAREAINSGSALKAFEGFRKASNAAEQSEKIHIEPEDDGGVAAKNGNVMAWYKRQEDIRRERSESRSRDPAEGTQTKE